MDTVAANEDISFDTRKEGAGTVGELGPDGSSGVGRRISAMPAESNQMMPSVNASLSKALDDRLVKDPEQLTAMDGELRPAVAGCDTAGLSPYPLPAFRVVDELSGGNGHRIEPIEQAQLGQFPRGVRQDVDADTQFLHAGRRFVDVHVTEAGRMEREGQRHAANAAAGNRDLHVN